MQDYRDACCEVLELVATHIRSDAQRLTNALETVEGAVQRLRHGGTGENAKVCADLDKTMEDLKIGGAALDRLNVAVLLLRQPYQSTPRSKHEDRTLHTRKKAKVQRHSLSHHHTTEDDEAEAEAEAKNKVQESPVLAHVKPPKVEAHRLQRAHLLIVTSFRSSQLADGTRHYTVVSDGSSKTVRFSPLTNFQCSCKDHEYRGNEYLCKHILYVVLHLGLKLKANQYLTVDDVYGHELETMG